MSGSDTPMFTVVRGGLDEVELAALTAVLAACRSRDRTRTGGPAAPRSPKWRARRFLGPRRWTSATTASRPSRAVPHPARGVRG